MEHDLIKLTDLKTDEEFDMFKEVLSRISALGNTIVTLRQVSQNPDGSYKSIDLQQIGTETRALFRIDNTHCFVSIRGDSNSKKIQSLWETVLQRGTSRFKKGQMNDYVLTIDIVAKEKNEDRTSSYDYILSCISPVFGGLDGNNAYTYVFDIEDVRCAKVRVDYQAIDYEIAIREESGDEVHNFDNSIDDSIGDIIDEDEEFDENDDILSNDNITNV